MEDADEAVAELAQSGLASCTACERTRGVRSSHTMSDSRQLLSVSAITVVP